MYSDKEQVNILTALLVKHGVRHAVVCPGSRNAPITHNLSECPTIHCYPVTDERSAGFYALGMAQCIGEPVAVCVTSGSALLNLAPAVAEAYYQQVPVVVISADRPAAWIGQLDGQTLPQPDALERFVKRAVSLPEPHNAEERWYCNRLINEALLAANHHGQGPVHINVPIAEPLFSFTVPRLPDERMITRWVPRTDKQVEEQVMARLAQAEHPWVLAGVGASSELAPWMLATNRLEESLATSCETEPDFALYLGGTLVGKRLKQYLRRRNTEIWMVSEDGKIHDLLMHATRILECAPSQLAAALPPPEQTAKVSQCSDNLFAECVRLLEERRPEESIVHYANSTAARLAATYARHHYYCNRGVNGIEGSLSTAAGFSVLSQQMVFCVIGDLSFFYDQNALWNQNLRGNMRIVLLNDGGGGIFGKLPGLTASPAHKKIIAAAHHATAEGICQQNNIYYQCAADREGLQRALNLLLADQYSRPMLLEVLC